MKTYLKKCTQKKSDLQIFNGFIKNGQKSTKLCYNV